MSVQSLETRLSELRSEPKANTRNRLKHADFARNLPGANPCPACSERPQWRYHVGRSPILLARPPEPARPPASRSRVPRGAAKKETARRHALTWRGPGSDSGASKQRQKCDSRRLASLLVLHVAGHQRKQLTSEREHVSLGKAACAKLSVDVLREDSHRAWIGFRGGRSDWGRLRHC
jgi:hypothetical protein